MTELQPTQSAVGQPELHAAVAAVKTRGLEDAHGGWRRAQAAYAKHVAGKQDAQRRVLGEGHGLGVSGDSR